MGQARKKYTQQYRDEAVELVISSGRPIAEIARDLGINDRPVRLEEARSRHAPALCSHQGGLILAWTGTDRHLNLARVATSPRRQAVSA